MSTYKRRIVYLSDKEWAGVQQRAKGIGMTASAYIRDLANGKEPEMERLLERASDADLDLVATLAGFNTRPFTPVPKKGK